MDKYKILIVEDDHEIANFIEIYLNNQGYDVIKAENGQIALDILQDTTIHLALVDVMMPIMDGISFTMNAKQRYDFPIIMLTAKSEDIDKITGLNIGADDYVTKPFVIMELLARINSALRRYQKFLDLKNTEVKANLKILEIEDLELNLDSRELMVAGNLTKLTPIEYKILELLMTNANRIYSSEQIYEAVWNDVAVGTETVLVHIRNLREKIEIDPKNPRYLKVVWGVGYKIEKRQ